LDQSGKFGGLVKSNSSWVDLFAEETSEDEEEDEVEEDPDAAGDEGEAEEDGNDEERDTPVLPADHQDQPPSPPDPSRQRGMM